LFQWVDGLIPIGFNEPALMEPLGPVLEKDSVSEKPSGTSEEQLSVSEPEAELTQQQRSEKSPEVIPKAKRVKVLNNSPRSQVRQKESAPPVSHISKAMLSRWAEIRLFPNVSFRSAEGDLPAGLELLNGSAYGIGLQPNDRLVAINGQTVSSPAHALGIILGARGAMLAIIQAQVVRNDGDDIRTFFINFAQPYGPELPQGLRPIAKKDQSTSEQTQPNGVKKVQNVAKSVVSEQKSGERVRPDLQYFIFIASKALHQADALVVLRQVNSCQESYNALS
jgi:hypothetical protein